MQAKDKKTGHQTEEKNRKVANFPANFSNFQTFQRDKMNEQQRERKCERRKKT